MINTKRLIGSEQLYIPEVILKDEYILYKNIKNEHPLYVLAKGNNDIFNKPLLAKCSKAESLHIILGDIIIIKGNDNISYPAYFLYELSSGEIFISKIKLRDNLYGPPIKIKEKNYNKI